MTATSSLARARARAHMAKEASFMSTVKGGAARIGSFFRRKPDVGGATKGVKSMLTKDFDQRLRAARVAKIKASGKGDLLARLQKRMRTTAPAATAAAPAATPKAAKKGLGLGKKMLIGGGLLAGGAAIGGGMSAAKVRAQQPLAPAETVPPGY